MRKDAEAHKAEDEERRKKVEARNAADQAVFAAEKFVRESGDKVAPEDKESLETAIKEAKEALQGDDVDAITAKAEALQKAMEPVVVKMYQQAAQQAEAGGAPPGESAAGPEWTGKPTGGGKDDVVDADFKVKEDSKKSANGGKESKRSAKETDSS
jgi:molecular chaperone DnaK